MFGDDRSDPRSFFRFFLPKTQFSLREIDFPWVLLVKISKVFSLALLAKEVLFSNEPQKKRCHPLGESIHFFRRSLPPKYKKKCHGHFFSELVHSPPPLVPKYKIKICRRPLLIQDIAGIRYGYFFCVSKCTEIDSKPFDMSLYNSVGIVLLIFGDYDFFYFCAPVHDPVQSCRWTYLFTKNRFYPQHIPKHPKTTKNRWTHLVYKGTVMNIKPFNITFYDSLWMFLVIFSDFGNASSINYVTRRGGGGLDQRNES